jgi:hypothetical protein
MLFPEGLRIWLWPSELRRGKRRSAVPLVAYYWDGTSPSPRQVKDISSVGMYLLTEDRWSTNTLVTMTLTRTDWRDAAPDRFVRVMGRVTRIGEDGVAVAFVWPGKHEENSFYISDRRTLDKFLGRLGKPLPTYDTAMEECCLAASNCSLSLLMRQI